MNLNCFGTITHTTCILGVLIAYMHTKLLLVILDFFLVVIAILLVLLIASWESVSTPRSEHFYSLFSLKWNGYPSKKKESNEKKFESRLQSTILKKRVLTLRSFSTFQSNSDSNTNFENDLSFDLLFSNSIGSLLRSFGTALVLFSIYLKGFCRAVVCTFGPWLHMQILFDRESLSFLSTSTWYWVRKLRCDHHHFNASEATSNLIVISHTSPRKGFNSDLSVNVVWYHLSSRSNFLQSQGNPQGELSPSSVLLLVGEGCVISVNRYILFEETQSSLHWTTTNRLLSVSNKIQLGQDVEQFCTSF